MLSPPYYFLQAIFKTFDYENKRSRRIEFFFYLKETGYQELFLLLNIRLRQRLSLLFMVMGLKIVIQMVATTLCSIHFGCKISRYSRGIKAGIGDSQGNWLHQSMEARAEEAVAALN